MADKESDMEKALIKQLTTDVSQWKYRPDIHNEEELLQNLRQKLNANNLDKLNDTPLTDEEFRRVKQELYGYAQSPYKAAHWLTGENGEVFVVLTRNDGSKIHLMVMNSREIAGGHSSYEVIHQYVADKNSAKDRTRRFDVTLLINGLPMIQIELKNQDHSYMDAFRQIKKYNAEGKFSGLFGLLQMYVVTNGENTRYIAAARANELNENFLTPWVDAENNPVEYYLDFAKVVLQIPMAHQMIGLYSVLDTESKKLILLRPYQIHAIEKVKAASARGESGFIWHTTGSGKTLTSYTVAKNLLLIPGIDKTIFLIDRKALDLQTSSAFQAYAENDVVDVDNTEHTGALVAKLKSKNRLFIVTTIQKLSIVMKRYTEKEKQGASSTAKRLHSLRIAFVVDECHRTVTPEKQRALKKFFAYSLWYGFTGTPIFPVNQREQRADLPRTTEGMFGKCLHYYTIKEALKDHAVLGFLIDYKDTISQEEVLSLGEQLKLGNIDNLTRQDDCRVAEKVLNSYKAYKKKDIYDTEEHRKFVVDYIINKAAGKFHLHAKRGEAHEAILTVPSIPIAQEYYKLFQKFIAEGRVKDSIQKLPCEGFPKVAITYSVTENDANSEANQKDMHKALDDYNRQFETHYELEDIDSYNKNLNARLARKLSQFKKREEQVDIVIVVDRLLTGFDAPACALLFVDRPPMMPQTIIQAFSRTNRILDGNKPYGLIVIFQHAKVFKEKVDEALKLYSHVDTEEAREEISALAFATVEKELRKAIRELRALASRPEEVDMLAEMQEKKAFAKAFQKLDRLQGEIQIYDDWGDKKLEDYGFTAEELTAYSGKYQNVVEELRQVAKADTDAVMDINVEYRLENIMSTTVDYRYIVALMQKYVPDTEEKTVAPIQDTVIDEHLQKLHETNAPLADVMQALWNDMKQNPAQFRGQNVKTILERSIDAVIEERIQKFTEEWATDAKDIEGIINTYKDGDKITMATDYDTYTKTHPDISKLRYKRLAREAVAQLVKEIRRLRDM